MVQRVKKRIEYQLHQWFTTLVVLDRIVLLIAAIALFTLRADVVVLVSYIFIPIYLFFTKRWRLLYFFGVATLLALIWNIIGAEQYGYNQNFFSIFGLNAFPLFAWSSGLFASYLIYTHLEHKVFTRTPKFIPRLLFYTAMYWPALLFMETFMYHVVGLQNDATGQYTGLPLCDCIHAPWWMQLVYLFFGPFYFSVCAVLGLKNPMALLKKIK